MCLFLSETKQWRIQDFLEEGAPTLQGGANIRFCQIFPKTAWNWKNSDPRGGARPKFYYVDPPLQRASDCCKLFLINDYIHLSITKGPDTLFSNKSNFRSKSLQEESSIMRSRPFKCCKYDFALASVPWQLTLACIVVFTSLANQKWNGFSHYSSFRM